MRPSGRSVLFYDTLGVRPSGRSVLFYDLAHLAGWNLRSSSVSVSLWMVMMLTAGLGVSEMTIG